jgi:hypothetical protein
LSFTVLLPTPIPTATPIPNTNPASGGGQPAGPASGNASQPLSGTPTAEGTSTPAAEATPGRTEESVISSQNENEPEGEIVTTSQNQPAGMTPERTGNVLWGASAAAAIAAATAYALAEQKKRKEEEARQRLEAEQQNADARAREAEWNQALAEHAKNAGEKGDSSGSATGSFSNTGSKKTTQIATYATGKATGEFNNKASAKGSITNTSHGALASTNTGTLNNTVRGTLPATSKKALGSTKKIGREEKPWYQQAWDTLTSGAAAAVQSVSTFFMQTVPSTVAKLKDDVVEAWNTAVTFVTQTIPQRADAFVQSIFPAFQDEKVRQTGKAVGAIVGTGALLYGGYKVGLDIYCGYVLSKSTSLTPGLLMFVFPLSAVVMSGEKRLRSGLLSLLIMGILLTGCTGGTSTTPVPGQTPTWPPICTPTPTEPPTSTVTPTPFIWPGNYTLTANGTLWNCNDVALAFGVSVPELLAVNPGVDCSSVVPGVTQFNIPALDLKTPSEYVEQYNCQATSGEICLLPNDSVETMIAYTLFNEGGSTQGDQFSADVMQVILNHANQLLENWESVGFDRNTLTRDDYARLLLYIIAKPAASGAGVAAFEAFSEPAEPPVDGSTSWNDALQMAQVVLDSRGQKWIENYSDPSVLDGRIADQEAFFYCSVITSEDPPLGSVLRIPSSGTGVNDVVTYFFNGYQYNSTVHQWCQDHFGGN